jgi:hypothetical protein
VFTRLTFRLSDAIRFFFLSGGPENPAHRIETMHYHSPIGVERSLRRRRSGGIFHRSVERSLVYDPSDMEATLAHRGPHKSVENEIEESPMLCPPRLSSCSCEVSSLNNVPDALDVLLMPLMDWLFLKFEMDHPTNHIAHARSYYSSDK